MSDARFTHNALTSHVDVDEGSWKNLNQVRCQDIPTPIAQCSTKLCTIGTLLAFSSAPREKQNYRAGGILTMPSPF